MRIEREQHSLDGGLGGFFVIDLAGISIFDGRYRFAIIGFDLIGFVLIFSRLTGIDYRQVTPGRTRTHTAGDGGRHDYKNGNDGELSGHRQELLGDESDENITQRGQCLKRKAD